MFGKFDLVLLELRWYLRGKWPIKVLNTWYLGWKLGSFRWIPIMPYRRRFPKEKWRNVPFMFSFKFSYWSSLSIKDQWWSSTIFNWISYPFSLHFKEKHHTYKMDYSKEHHFWLFHIELTILIKVWFLSYMINKNFIFKQ